MAFTSQYEPISQEDEEPGSEDLELPRYVNLSEIQPQDPLGGIGNQYMRQPDGISRLQGLHLTNSNRVTPETQAIAPRPDNLVWTNSHSLNFPGESELSQQHGDAVKRYNVMPCQSFQNPWLESRAGAAFAGAYQNDGFPLGMHNARNIDTSQRANSSGLETYTFNSVNSGVPPESDGDPDFSVISNSTPSGQSNSPELDNRNKSMFLVWNPTTGEQTPEAPSKNPRTPAEREQTAELRRSGGACDDCKKNHRKCKLEHPPSTNIARRKRSSSRSRRPPSRARKLPRRDAQTALEEDTAGLGGQFNDPNRSFTSEAGLCTEDGLNSADYPSHALSRDMAVLDSLWKRRT